MKRPTFCALLRRGRAAFTAAAAFCGLTLSAATGDLVAADYYLKIEGIPGEIAEGRFQGWSKVDGISAAASRPPTVPPGESRAIIAVSVAKPVDRMSPELLVHCATGQHIPKVTLACQEGNLPYLRITLTDVLVSSFETSSPEAPPTEMLSFNFQKIEWSHSLHNGLTGGLTSLFDVVSNRGTSRIRSPFVATLERRPGQLGLHLSCPVEAGHSYRIMAAPSPAGPWTRIGQITAEADGSVNQEVPISTPLLFLRVEEID